MSPGTFEKLILIPDVGEFLIRIFRTSKFQLEGELSWIGIISCRDCSSKPFKEVFYVVEEEAKQVKESLSKILKNLYLGDHHDGKIF